MKFVLVRDTLLIAPAGFALGEDTDAARQQLSVMSIEFVRRSFHSLQQRECFRRQWLHVR